MRLSYMFLFAAALSLISGAAALADVQVTQTVHFKQTIPDIPAYRKLPAAQRAMMEKQMDRPPYTLTTHVHGKVTRLDYGQYYELAKAGKSTFLIINAGSRSYVVQHFSYFKDSGGAKAVKVTVQQTRRTRMISGHRCHDYHIASLPGDPSDFMSDVWAADDIPNTPGPMVEAEFNGVFLDPWPSIKGLPLEVTAQIGTKTTGIGHLSITTSSIKSASEPESMFIAPKGYSQSFLH